MQISIPKEEHCKHIIKILVQWLIKYVSGEYNVLTILKRKILECISIIELVCPHALQQYSESSKKIIYYILMIVVQIVLLSKWLSLN